VLIVESVNPSSSVVRSRSLAPWTSLVALSLVSCRGFLSELTFCQNFLATALGSPTSPAHCQSGASRTGHFSFLHELFPAGSKCLASGV